MAELVKMSPKGSNERRKRRVSVKMLEAGQVVVEMKVELSGDDVRVPD